MSRSLARNLALSCTAIGSMLFTDVALVAQDAPEDDESVVIVTGTRIRQGGSQDIRQFRSISLNQSFLPRSDSLTIEGLLGEHDLALPNNKACDQLFCINGQAMKAEIPSRPQDNYFVGLGFDSNADASALQAEPLSIVAVVDKSGSMSGAKTERVKEALLEALAKMRDDDRFGIVVFGSDTSVLLPVGDVGGNREMIAEVIGSIEAEGSTYMEAGLRQGFDVAFAEQAQNKRKTRIMLLTDEQPNVGNVEPEGFMGQAVAGSKRGVGMTTIGVGRDFDNALAMQISSVRGGNIFYLAQNGDARDLMQREFYNMVTEVAHDVVITLAPSTGYSINAVYGVPNEIINTTTDGAVTVRIGSAFLASNGGGIFVSMADKSAGTADPSNPILSAAVTYTEAKSGVAGANSDVVRLGAGSAPANLAKAQLLVDQYLTLTSALDAYHKQGDRQTAFSQLDGLLGRMESAEVQGMQREVDLVRGLRNRSAALAGVGEVPDELKPLQVLGKWEVTAQSGLRDVARGDIIELTENGQFITYRKSGREAGNEVRQSFQVNENQLYIDYTSLVFRYRLKNDRLRMRTIDNERLDLKRVEAST